MENFFCMSIRVLANFIKKDLNEKIAALGLTGFQCGVLNYIEHSTKGDSVVFQKNLEEFFVTSKSSMSDLLQSLESKGLIVRVSPEQGDSRKKEIKLTKEGKRIITISHRFLDETENFLLSALDDEEKEELFKILTKFNERMEKKI